MKKLFLIISIFLGITTSCGGSSESSNSENTEVDTKNYIMQPQSTTISGPLGNAYTVVQRKYKAKKDDTMPNINVELELSDPTKLPEGFSAQQVGTRENIGDTNYQMMANFIIEFLDEDGDIIETNEESYGVGPVLRLSQGERGSVKFYLPFKHEDEVKYFRIKSDYYPNEITISEKIIEEGNNNADEEFNKAMEQAEKAMETTTKMMKEVINLAK